MATHTVAIRSIPTLEPLTAILLTKDEVDPDAKIFDGRTPLSFVAEHELKAATTRQERT
jgi:hypothetical protein